MKVLENLNIDDIIFIDIETVRCENVLTKESQMFDAWLYKTRYMNDLNGKMETSSMTPEELFNEKAALYAPFSKVACITIGKIVENGTKIKLHSYYGKDEFELLNNFNNNLNSFFNKNNNIYFLGFNIIKFDIPFIIKRMLVNNIKPSYVLDKGNAKPWELKDIDLSDIWKGTSYYPDSLLAVSAAMGLESPKVDISGSETSEYYWNVDNGVYKIAKYCEKDVITTINLFLKFVQKDIISIFVSNLKE